MGEVIMGSHKESIEQYTQLGRRIKATLIRDVKWLAKNNPMLSKMKVIKRTRGYTFSTIRFSELTNWGDCIFIKPQINMIVKVLEMTEIKDIPKFFYNLKKYQGFLDGWGDVIPINPTLVSQLLDIYEGSKEDESIL